ncbi:MAG: homoserine dehydrogenase [Dehalococcoidia bacterium]|nr:homoserine dehydrogenase [Dehalococcoidia bacterium]
MAYNRERPVKIGLMGLGVIGSGVARVLTEKADMLSQRIGAPLSLARVLEKDSSKARALSLGPITTADAEAFLADPDLDIVIELLGGEEPAHQYIVRSLEAGRYVVTANKEVMAKHGVDLLSLARTKRADIFYEGSVGGGIPIIAPLKRDLLANDITAISAIINGTTNYILTQMSREGRDFADALARAQSLGYAEADPTNDIEGIDASYKLAILAGLAFHVRVTPDQIYREGISRLTSKDFRYAGEMGYAIKLLAVAKREDERLQLRVHPVLLPEGEPLAKVDGVLNAVQVEGDLIGRAMFQGPGAGSLPTSGAVVADVVNAAHALVNGRHEPIRRLRRRRLSVRPMDELRTRYYIRMTVTDRPGVLAQIASVLGRNNISIATVIQKEADEAAQTAEIVITTHEARERSVQVALQKTAALEVVTEVGGFIRVEG